MRHVVLAAALLLPLAVAAQPVAPAGPSLDRDRSLPALALSAGATAVGVGAALAVYELDGRGGFEDPAYLVGAAAVALAPSVGNLWLGESGDALAGAALRTAGIVAMTYAIENVSLIGPSSTAVDLAAVAGLVAFTGGLGYEIVTQIDNGERSVRLRPEGAGLALTVDL